MTEAIAFTCDRHYARHLATYITDPAKVRRYTLAEYNRAPSLEWIKRKQQEYRSKSDLPDYAEARREPSDEDGVEFRVGPSREALSATNWAQVKASAPGSLSGKPPRTAEGIIAVTAQWFKLTPADITGPSRKARIATARFVAIKLIWDHLRSGDLYHYSYPVIGKIMGGRDHSTIMYAHHTFYDRARKYPEMLTGLAACERLLAEVGA